MLKNWFNRTPEGASFSKGQFVLYGFSARKVAKIIQTADGTFIYKIRGPYLFERGVWVAEHDLEAL